MAIYVDDLQPTPKFRQGYYCHLMTDGDLKELHQFAISLGLKPAWFQRHIFHPHYDLLGSAMRDKAIKAGAIPVSSKEQIKKCSRLFTERETP